MTASLIDWRYRLRGIPWKHLYLALPYVILFMAAALRLHWLGHQSFWNDEGNTLRLVERSIPDLLVSASRDIHPPGYYLLLKSWWLLTGESEFALRAFSALCGTITVACVYTLGRTLFSRGAGTVAALLVAINTFAVYYSQEARMYALLALMAAAGMLLFVRWTRRPSWPLALGLALVNAAGLYTQYVFPFIMLTQGVLFVLWWLGRRDRASLGQYVALNLLTLILFVPQLSTALAQIRQWPRTGVPTDTLTGLTTIVRWLTYGNTMTAVDWTIFIWPVLFALAALLPDWRSSPGQPSWWRRALPWLWLAICILPFFALGLFREANLKFLLPEEIAAALLMGRGIALLWEIGSANLNMLIEALPRVLAVAGTASILSYSNTALTSLYTDPAFARSDYRAMAAVVSIDPRPGDAIILDAPNQAEVFTYYYHGSAPLYSLPEGLGGDDAKTAAQVTTVIDKSQRLYVLYWGETERDPNRIVEKTLMDRAFEVNSNWYGDVRLVRYAKIPQVAATPTGIKANFGDSIQLQNAALSAASLQAGDVLGITLTWTTTKTLTERYKVFLHLLNAQGEIVAQRDAEPGNNMALTTTWQPGQPVIDTHGLLLPASLPAGNYTLILGLYDLNDPQQRLLVNGGDHVILGTISVTQ